MIAVISQAAPQRLADALRARGYAVVALPPFDALDAPVASHPDMLLLHLGTQLFCPAAYVARADVEPLLQALACKTGLQLAPLPPDEVFSTQYPNDVRLNVLLCGSVCFALPSGISPTVRSAAQRASLSFVPVRQGYAHCSSQILTAPDGTHALITADVGMAQAAKRVDVPTLLLPSDTVFLAGYAGRGGLVGGATGFDEQAHTLYLCGMPPPTVLDDLHAFCLAHDCRCHPLTDEPWYDVGGIQFYSDTSDP